MSWFTDLFKKDVSNSNEWEKQEYAKRKTYREMWKGINSIRDTIKLLNKLNLTAEDYFTFMGFWPDEEATTYRSLKERISDRHKPLRELGKILHRFHILDDDEYFILWASSGYHKLKQNLDKRNALEGLKRVQQEIKDSKTKQRSRSLL